MLKYTQYLKKLSLICRKKGFLMVEIGQIGRRGYPLFKVVINPFAQGKAICFSAGIHGNEKAGPLAVLEFLKNFSNDNPAQKIILFPIVNATGWERHRRYNYLGKDLNRRFCHKKLTGENKLVYDSIRGEKIYFFHSLHEDWGEKRFYLYILERKPQHFYRQIIKLAQRYFPINTNPSIYDEPALNGLVINTHDGSFEDRMFWDGVPFSMCSETPGREAMDRRVKLTVEIMNRVVKFVQKRLHRKNRAANKKILINQNLFLQPQN